MANRFFPLTALSIICAASLCSCKREEVGTAKQAAPQAPLAVKTIHPFNGDIMRNVALPGSILPNQQATLYAKISGYLQKITVDKGDVVKEGDLIAAIEAPELIADAAKFKADLDIAEIDFKRTAEAQQKAPDLVVLQSVDAAKAKYLAAKASLQRAETLSSFTKILAPFAGTITKRFVDPGAFIPAATAGATAQGAAIVTIMDFSVVRVQIAVPEPEVPRIKNGLPVQVIVDELPGKNFTGTITRYSHSLDEAKTMLVEVDLPNAKSDLLPGMYATTKIGVEKKQNALLIPIEALVMEKVNAFAFVATGGKAKKIPIKIGFNDGTNVEVLNGLAPSDEVVLVGKRTIVDGQPLTTTEAK